MKLRNSNWIKISRAFPIFTKQVAAKQVDAKVASLSESIVDKRTPFLKPMAMLIPMLVIIGAFTVTPLVYNIIDSFFQPASSDNPTKQFTIRTFVEIFNDVKFAVGVRNSIMYGLLVLPFVMAISLLISSLISTLYRKSAKGIFQTIFFLPYVTNVVAISLTFMQFFGQYGLFNQMFGLSTAWLIGENIASMKPFIAVLTQGVWSGLAFNILIFTTAMMSVDKNLYRSASIDGIGGFKQFFTITLPSIKSTTTFLITMGIINGIKVFPLALFNNNPASAIQNGMSTLMLYVYEAVQSATTDFSRSASAAIVLFAIGVMFSTIIRGGFNTIMKASLNLGENNVWNKIKNSKEMNQYKTSKKQG